MAVNHMTSIRVNNEDGQDGEGTASRSHIPQVVLPIMVITYTHLHTHTPSSSLYHMLNLNTNGVIPKFNLLYTVLLDLNQTLCLSACIYSTYILQNGTYSRSQSLLTCGATGDQENLRQSSV